MGVEWDPQKRNWTIKNRRIDFADAVSVLEDHRAITIIDNESEPTEERVATLGLDALGRLLVIVFTYAA